MDINLRDYQEQAVAYAKKRRVTYLNIGMGGGKTLCATHICRTFKQILIIAPAILLPMWKEKLIEYGERPKTISLFKGVIDITETKWIITSYSQIINLKKWQHLMQHNYEAVILDEAHYLKTISSKCTLSVLGNTAVGDTDNRLATKESVKKVVLLSGTPIMQRPIELYSVLKSLSPELIQPYDSYHRYVYRYCAPFKINKQLVVRGAERIPELQQKTEPLFFTVTQQQIDDYLPPISQHLVVFDIIKQTRRVHTLNDRIKFANKKIIVPLEITSETRKDDFIFKMEMLKQFIYDASMQYKKIVCFAYHKKSVELYPWNSIINGSTPSNSRQKIIKSFQESTQQIILCSLDSAAEGIDLHTAEALIFLEFSWNQSQNNQAIKRVHRHGISKQLPVFYCIGDNTIDYNILANNIKGQKIVDAFTQ